MIERGGEKRNREQRKKDVFREWGLKKMRKQGNRQRKRKQETWRGCAGKKAQKTEGMS